MKVPVYVCLCVCVRVRACVRACAHPVKQVVLTGKQVDYEDPVPMVNGVVRLAGWQPFPSQAAIPAACFPPTLFWPGASR